MSRTRYRIFNLALFSQQTAKPNIELQKFQLGNAKHRTKTHRVEGALQILSGSIGKKDQEEGRAENMNISGVVLLWGLNRRTIRNQRRLLVVGVHLGLGTVDPIDRRIRALYNKSPEMCLKRVR
jgi:hypothetical protein